MGSKWTSERQSEEILGFSNANKSKPFKQCLLPRTKSVSSGQGHGLRKKILEGC